MKVSALVSFGLLNSAIASPSFSNFKQNVFSSQNQVLLEYPQIFKEYHHHCSLADGTVHLIEVAWKHLMKEVPATELKELFDIVQKQVKHAAQDSKEQNLYVSDYASDEFDVLEHEDDKYSLRSKPSGIESLGLDTVEQFVGYFDVRDVDKHFFYWFFESRNDPENDPIILWLNGGPGCASDGGLFFELGPSFIDHELKPIYNPYSWNANASVIFLDQPVGVGYSYAGKEDVDSSPRAAHDVYIFLELFFQKFPKFLNNKFHVSGESYAGHYVPRIAAEIIRHPERSFELSSVLVGNGAVDQFYQKHYDQKMICGEGGLNILSPENCTQMETYLTRCLNFQQLCSLHSNVLTCVPASYYCNKSYGPLDDLNLNRYDLRRPCEDNRLCYNDINYVSEYMNLDYVKEAVGVPKDLKFEFCKLEVGQRFRNAHDGQVPFQKFIAEVLDYGVPVLHYAGDQDFVCHWLGYNAVSNSIKYKNQEIFSNTEFKPWISNGKEAGEVRGYNNFTFLRVYDAGHMVPHDQPEIALDMLNTWLSGNYDFN